MRHRFAGGGGEQCRRLPTPVPAKTRAAVRLHQVVQAAQDNYTAFETIASGEYDKRRRKLRSPCTGLDRTVQVVRVRAGHMQ